MNTHFSNYYQGNQDNLMISMYLLFYGPKCIQMHGNNQKLLRALVYFCVCFVCVLRAFMAFACVLRVFCVRFACVYDICVRFACVLRAVECGCVQLCAVACVFIKMCAVVCVMRVY